MVRVDTKFLFKKKHFAPLSPKLGGGARRRQRQLAYLDLTKKY